MTQLVDYSRWDHIDSASEDEAEVARKVANSEACGLGYTSGPLEHVAAADVFRAMALKATRPELFQAPESATLVDTHCELLDKIC